jgi:hypothetical protein
MQPDKYKRRQRVPHADQKVRRQIAREAARRLAKGKERDPDEGGSDNPTWLMAASEADLYAAKRKAAAVLGHKIRPGDLPTDDEVRQEVRTWLRNVAREELEGQADDEQEADREDPPLGPMTDHLDRFTVFRMWLMPLEAVKQNPRSHPEGDALYHSLQVFELARTARPYDEEFLLAALLHDVGKGIDPEAPRKASVETLRGAVTDRTLWLIAGLHDLPAAREGTPEDREDLDLLKELDLAGRVPGVPVPALDEVFEAIRELEDVDE